MFNLFKKKKKIDLSMFLSWDINPEIGPATPLGDILGVIPRVEFPSYVYYWLCLVCLTCYLISDQIVPDKQLHGNRFRPS